MNAFTQKPDISKFIKEQKHALSGKKAGAIRSAQLGGQIVPGMGDCNREKVAIKPNAPRP